MRAGTWAAPPGPGAQAPNLCPGLPPCQQQLSPVPNPWCQSAKVTCLNRQREGSCPLPGCRCELIFIEFTYWPGASLWICIAQSPALQNTTQACPWSRLSTALGRKSQECTTDRVQMGTEMRNCMSDLVRVEDQTQQEITLIICRQLLPGLHL